MEAEDMNTHRVCQCVKRALCGQLRSACLSTTRREKGRQQQSDGRADIVHAAGGERLVAVMREDDGNKDGVAEWALQEA